MKSYRRGATSAPLLILYTTMLLNDNFKLLSKSYLFSEVASRIRDFKAQHPDAEIIRMDIGDVTLHLCKRVAEAIAQAAI